LFIGQKPAGTRLVPMLGDIKVRDLATSEIRAWHKTLSAEVGWYSANRAKMFLGAVLALAAEDLNIRPPAMPANLGRGKSKVKKAILASGQVTPCPRRRAPIGRRASAQRATGTAVGGCRFRRQRHPHQADAGARRLDHQPDQDRRRDAGHPDVQPCFAAC
jgi:hypothetical protein